MWTITRRFVPLALLAVLGLGLMSPSAQAQTRLPPSSIAPYRGQPINRNWLVAPGVTIRQWSYNTRQMGRAYASIPPYMLGYNPYPQVINYGPNFPAPIYNYPSLYNPYTYGSYYANPYNPYNLYGYSYLYP
jgi:hypothetical protein